MAGLFLRLSAVAAPFAEWIEVPLPGGGTVSIWGEGDGYDASFKAEGGHAPRLDREACRYECVSPDGATRGYAGTGVFLGDEAGNEIKGTAKDARHTVRASDTMDGTRKTATSVKAIAAGPEPISSSAPSSKPTRSVRIGVSDAQVPSNTEL